jgi:hypothetical protein
MRIPHTRISSRCEGRPCTGDYHQTVHGASSLSVAALRVIQHWRNRSLRLTITSLQTTFRQQVDAQER